MSLYPLSTHNLPFVQDLWQKEFNRHTHRCVHTHTHTHTHTNRHLLNMCLFTGVNATMQYSLHVKTNSSSVKPDCRLTAVRFEAASITDSFLVSVSMSCWLAAPTMSASRVFFS